MPDEFDDLESELRETEVDAAQLTRPRLRYLSCVGKGANAHGWRIYKGEDGEPVVVRAEENAADRATIAKGLAARALRYIRALGGGTASRDTLALKIAEATGGTTDDVVALAFDKAAFDAVGAGNWARQHGFKADGALEQDEDGILMAQAEATPGTECTQVVLGEGVAAVVRRSGAMGPAAFERLRYVGETATLRRRRPPMPGRVGSVTKVHALLFDKAAFADTDAVRKWVTEEGAVGAMTLTLKAGNIEGLASHYGDEEHPFSACYADMVGKGHSEEEARNICGKMKGAMNGGESEAAKAEVSPFTAADVVDIGEAFRVPQGGEAPTGALTAHRIAKGVVAIIEGATVEKKESDIMDQKALERIIKDAIDKGLEKHEARLAAIETKVKEASGGDAPNPEGGEPAAADLEAVSGIIKEAIDARFGGIEQRVVKMEQRLGARIVPPRRGADPERIEKDDDDEPQRHYSGLVSFKGRVAR